MSDEPVIVNAGTRIYSDTGQFLEVTDITAVGMHGKLYQTEYWAKRTAASKAAWDGRSRWRKWFDMPPKGYEPEGQPVESLLGSLFGSLFQPNR
jgi:hypothetical protein